MCQTSGEFITGSGDRQPTILQSGQKSPDCRPSVGEQLLLGPRNLGECAAQIIVEKDRIVPEAALSTKVPDDPSFHVAVEGGQGLSCFCNRDHRAVTGGALVVGKLLKIFQKFQHSAVIVQAFTTITGGVHAGCAAEGIDLQA